MWYLTEVDKFPFKCLTVRGDKFKKLSDIDKFKKLDVKPGKELSLLLKHEDKLVYFLKGIIKYIGKKLYKSLFPQGLQPGTMYGSSKIHKPPVNGFPKLRPILSALNTGTSKWAK